MRLRLSLKSILLVVSLLAVVLGLSVRRIARQSAAAAALMRSEAELYFDDDTMVQEDDYFRHLVKSVRRVVLHPSERISGDEQIALTMALPTVTTVWVWPLQHVSEPETRIGELYGVTDSGIATMLELLPNLESIDIQHANCSRGVVDKLENEHPQLKNVSVVWDDDSGVEMDSFFR